MKIHGYTLGRKAYYHCLIWFKNFNGIPVIPWQSDNINIIRNMGRQIGADVILGVELNIKFSMIRAEHRLEELLLTETFGRVTYGNNNHECLTNLQQGRTCVVIFNQVKTDGKGQE